MVTGLKRASLASIGVLSQSLRISRNRVRTSRWSPFAPFASQVEMFSNRAASDAKTIRELYKDQNDTWVDRRVPASMQPFAKLARIDRPIGTLLLLFPCLWSSALAVPNGTPPDLALASLFTLGSFVMRGAGCTINDYWDRDIDGKVARTSQRPLASGAISETQALAFFAAQSLVGLGVLVQMNWPTIVLASTSLAPVVLYPLAKRYTRWPQAVLGLTFNWGALVGWSAVHGSLDTTVVLPLYLGSVAWTLMYDTLYAYQDKADDKQLGLNSSALTIGDEWSKPVLSAFAFVAVSLWTVAGHQAGLDKSIIFHAGVGLSAMHMGWQIFTADVNDRLNLTTRFVSNQTIGAILLSGIVLGKYFEM